MEWGLSAHAAKGTQHTSELKIKITNAEFRKFIAVTCLYKITGGSYSG